MCLHDPRPIPDSEPPSTDELAQRHMPPDPPPLPEPSDDAPEDPTR
jgi:hypothetical protein